MKIITLNTWGGRVSKELMDFLSKNQDVDVFCFQEIYHRATHVHVEQGGIDPNLTLFDDMEKVLPNHVGYFRPNYIETYGLAMFIKKGLQVELEGEYYVHRHRGYIPEGEASNHARNIQVVVLKTNEGKLNIFNFHGLWNGDGKTDSEDRLNQSKKLAEYIMQFEGAKILCGDFNLEPQTESLKLIENLPMRNLVKEYKITSTRTSYYTKKVRFADYMLVNDDVKVIDFKVLPDEISDHSVLKLEITL
ncbi:MAG TPA: endonuclease/exonuclease/phosphatase family protein [Candidatus Paceibacterota bacterium]